MQTVSSKRVVRARSAIAAGALLLVWSAGAFVASGEFTALDGALAAVAAGLLVYGWLAFNHDRVGRAIEDVAAAIDPLVTPPRADASEGVDEIHAPGHAHVKRSRQ